MNGSWKRAAAASALCLGLAAAGVTAAQDRPQGPPPGAGQRGPGRPGFDRGKIFEEMRQRREQRLHDILQIKPNQEAAFHAFVAAMQPPPRDGKGGPGRERGRGPGAAPAPLTTPERLDRMQMRMAERQARFQQMAAATRAFYAALSPEQRKAFDVMPMRGGEHGGHGGGHFGGGRPGFGGPR